MLRLLRSASVTLALFGALSLAACDDDAPSAAIVDTTYALTATITDVEPASPGTPTTDVARTFALTMTLDDDATDTKAGTGTMSTRGRAAAFDYAIVHGKRTIATDWTFNIDAGACRGTTVQLTSITLEPVAAGAQTLRGTFEGAAAVFQGDVREAFTIRGTLEGGLDTTPPTIESIGTGGIFQNLSFVPSEALRPESDPVLVGPSGFSVALQDETTGGLLSIYGSNTLLPFGATLTLTGNPPFADFAGLAPTALPTVVTPPDPGLFAQDGFEGPVAADFGDGAEVRTVTGTEVAIAGDRVVFVPTGSHFVAKLAVPANATTIHLAWRALALSTPPTTGAPLLQVSAGVLGGLQVSIPRLAPTDAYAATSDGVASGIQTIDYVPHPDLVAVPEVVVQIDVDSWCGSPITGVVIDELRID